MAQEKQFQSVLPDLITQMFGTKSSSSTGKTSSTTQSVSANTAPLQQVFDQASAPMNQQLYDNLIASIFQKAAVQVPTLTAALANATGSRTSNNSPLALALNEQNNMAAKDSATAILGQQNIQAKTASDAAQGIAQATKAVNTTGTDTATQAGTTGKPGLNPLATTALGFLLNKADKGKWFEKLGSMFTPSPALASNFPVAAPSFGTGVGGADMPTFAENMPVMSAASPAPVMGGGAMDFNDLSSMFPGMDLSGLATSDLGAGALDNFDFSGLLSDFGGSNFGDMPFGDFGSLTGGGNAFTGGLDFGGSDLITEDIWKFFADGGKTSGAGRVQRNRNNMGRSPTLFGQSAINSQATPAAGSGGNQGVSSDVVMQMLQRVNQTQQAQQGRAPARAPGSPQAATSEDGNDREGAYQETAGGAVNARAGNPLGNSVAQALAMAALGLIAPQVMGGLTGSLPAAQMTNMGIKGATGQSTSPLNLATALAQAVAAERGATSAIETSEDPLGAMLAAFNSVDSSIGDLSAVSPGALAAGANAASAVTGSAPLDSLLQAAGTFQTGTPNTGGSGGDYGLAGGFGDTGGASLGGGLGGGGFGGIGSDGFGDFGDAGDLGDFADGGLTKLSTSGTSVKKKPSAGMIKGPGTGTSDSIRAKSTVPGGKGINVSGKEFIVPADVMQVPGVQTMLETLLKNYHTPVNR